MRVPCGAARTRPPRTPGRPPPRFPCPRCSPASTNCTVGATTRRRSPRSSGWCRRGSRAPRATTISSGAPPGSTSGPATIPACRASSARAGGRTAGTSPSTPSPSTRTTSTATTTPLVCMGNYALGLGVVKALSVGLEGKFRDRLGKAAALNDGYEVGGVDIAWGRFFDKLPWPKRDRQQAEEHLRRALQINPASLRARVYLAKMLPRQRPGTGGEAPPGGGRGGAGRPLRRARGTPGQGDGQRPAAGAGGQAQVSVVVASVVVAIAAGGCG